jgi:hypothetical protein
MNYLELLKLAAPEAIVVVTALAVLTIGLTTTRAFVLGPIVAVLGVALAIGVVLMLPSHANRFGGMLVISPLNSLFKIICLALAIATIPLVSSEKALPNPGEYIAVLLLGSVGLMLLVGSEELLMIFIGLELLGLSLYVLAAFDKADVHSAEAGLKYFLFGSTASAFTLFGISLIYGLSGTTALAAIGHKLVAPVQPLLAVGIVMTLIGFAFKIAAAPFHLWAPDAYQGAPIPSAAFIASGSKVASFVVLGKIVLVGFGPVHGSADWHAMIAGWSPLLAALAAFSILLGNFVALAQTNVPRLLRRRAWRLYFARRRCRRSRRIFRDLVLHHHLRGHTYRRIRGRRCGPGRNWRRRPAKFLRTGRSLTLPCRLYGYLFLIARWSAAIGGIFREVLFVQRSVPRGRKSRFALAGGNRALRQLRLALLLSDRPQSDLC